ncbi:MAG: esterase family protein [Bacteroidales bacterium]|nr:esterase family protein [Bacteroidales bacterium]
MKTKCSHNNLLLLPILVFLLIPSYAFSCNARGQVSNIMNFALQLGMQPEDKRDSMVTVFIAANPQTPLIENDTVFSLYWYGTASTVLVNGDLQGAWAAPDTMLSVFCGGKTFFYKTFTAPSEARLDYQLIVDSDYRTDPRNPFITPSGYGPHSAVNMPGFVPNPFRQYRSEVPHGSIDSLVFSSRDPDVEARKVKIYLPPSYSVEKDLPVLYVLDGFEAMDYMSWPVVLDNMIADEKIPPLVAVFLPPKQRSFEYMPGKKHAFLNALCDELVPLIDQNYHTSALPEKRGIAGISAGGHMALMTVLSRPDVFLCGAGQSASISMQLYEKLKKLPPSVKRNPALRIYIDVGRFDLPSGAYGKDSFMQAGQKFDQKLKESEIPAMFQIVNDGHEWASWRERTSDILLYLYGREY